MLRAIRKYLRLTRLFHDLGPLIFLGIIAGFLEFAGVASFASLISPDNSITKLHFSTSLKIFLLTFSFILAALVSRMIRKLINRANVRIEQNYRSAMIKYIESSEWSQISKISQGELLSNLISTPTMISNGLSAFLNVIISFAGMIPISIIISVRFPFLIGVIGIFFILGLYFIRPIRRRAEINEMKAQNESSVIGDQTSYVLGGLKAYFASSENQAWAQKLNMTIQELRKIRLLQLDIPVQTKFILDLFSALMLSGVVLFLTLTVDELALKIVILGLLVRTLPRVQSIQSDLLTVRVQSTWIDRWIIFLKKIESRATPRSYSVLNTKNFNEITICDFETRYEDSNFQLLMTQITLRKSNLYLLSGHSGSGKTTLLDCLLGLKQFNCKSIEIDNHRIDEWNPEIFGRRFYIPQHGLLSVGTLRSILDPNGLVGDNEIHKILKQVELDELVESLPTKLETNLVNLWSDFSGGQKQRFAVAQALLGNFDLLILDESMSGIESQLEIKMLEELKAQAKRNKSIVIYISHRTNYSDILFDYRIEMGGNLESE